MALTRRALLGGSAVAVAGLGVGGALVERDVLPGRPWLHERLGLNGPDGTIPDVAVGPTATGTVQSTLVSPRPAYRVLYPPGSRIGDALPVVICLHGARSSAAGWSDLVGLPQFLAASGHAMALALVDGDSSYWQAHEGGDYGRMVLEELLPVLGRRGLEIDRPAWLGWSMGGYGVLRLSAERHRTGDANGPVLAVSPALWPSYDDTAPGAFQDRAQYDAATALLDDVPVTTTRVDCGTGDPFYRNVVDFTDGRDLTVSFERGSHDAGYWTRVLPDQLDWLAARLG
ncbi:MAG: alpha/beta hydrolase-fold protein [Nocardioides sp.]|uniref:alpha/beta hydrolase n=1 Tax=Nocardioides sp. TaxID=35761 RepID=UPI0039E4BE1A